IIESKCIFSTPISASTKGDLKTIETTAVQGDNKLWIISSKEPYENKEEKNRKYFIQSIFLNNAQ
ncbi:MAG TPA: hypothetical protein VL201_03355, partial [Patescibacteria group bacterium]|nr:hypothetical protein [Patescibacteria group bacterium]